MKEEPLILSTDPVADGAMPTNGRADSSRPITQGLMQRVLDLFSSVWLGVLLLSLLFVYCSVGSAAPQIRELPGLELTEFEWFHWWPFNLLILLLGLNLVVVTLRRIPLRAINAGVWMIHTGIITLLAGSYIYFHRKIEGDTPVFRREVRIELPELKESKSMPALPGSAATVRAGRNLWAFEIQSTNSQWPILSEDDKGKNAYAVNVLVKAPDGTEFIRQLLADYPQYTEDILPGKGRAVKSTGKKLVNEELKLSLELAPQQTFHLMKSWALFVRKRGETKWQERLMPGMPRYHDRISSREQVFFDPRFPIALRPMDLDVPALPEGDALGSASVRVTGYLRYAQMKRRWRDGGGVLNPVLRITASSSQASTQSYELIALDPVHRRVENGNVEFIWLTDPAQVDLLPTDPRAVLRISVPQTSATIDLSLTADVVVGRDGPFTPIDGTDLSYRVLNVVDDLAMPDGRRPVSIAMVEIKSSEGSFTRMVADQPESTRDIHGDSDPHNPTARRAEQVDPRIQMTYRPRTAPVIFAAHPHGLFLAVNGPEGRMFGRTVQIGEDVEVIRGLSLRAESLLLKATQEEKPFVVPPTARDRGMEENMAMIRLELTTGHGVQTQWLRFNQYALPSEQYAYAGRLNYLPQTFRLDDGSEVEVLFSRRRMQLPHPVAMQDFELDTHLGGYSGSVSTIRNYVSRLRFQDGGQWSEPNPTAVNQPTHSGGFWFFQSMWDRPSPDDPTGGMNYTGLGVGNRHGVYVQLAGCCISVAGMLYAFYVKPVLKRKRRNAARAQLEEVPSQAEISDWNVDSYATSSGTEAVP